MRFGATYQRAHPLVTDGRQPNAAHGLYAARYN
jgi:hypothetical protein